MKITRKRETILERERSITIRFGAESKETFCSGCETLVRFITVDEAAAVAGTTSREIFRTIENGQVHFQETVRGRLLVCLTSLTKPPNEDRKLPGKISE